VRRRPLLVLVALVAGAAQAAPATAAPEVVVQYAPLVRLHPDEQAFPGRPVRDFVAKSKLFWWHEYNCGSCRDLVAGAGRVDARRLGRLSDSPYRWHAYSTDRWFSATQYTRPLGTESDRAGLSMHEGFSLDLPNTALARGGQPDLTQDAVFWEYLPGRFVTYWFFYPYNDGILGFNHEGDWEHIAVRLDSSDQPLAVAFFRHRSSCASIRAWGGRPEVRLPSNRFQRQGNAWELRERRALFDELRHLARHIRLHRLREGVADVDGARARVRAAVVRLRRGVGRGRLFRRHNGPPGPVAVQGPRAGRLVARARRPALRAQ
jgi:hypothetical protein